MDNPANTPDIDYTPPQPPQEAGGGTGKKVAIGCGIGCLVIIIVAIIAGVLFYNYVVNTALGFTSEEGVEFVEPAADQATIDAAVAKYDAFKQAMSSGQDAAPLVLTGAEFNLLIWNHPDFSALKGFGEVAIEEDRFTARISVPLDNFGEGLPKKLRGRYLNGEATIRLLLNQGFLEVYLVDLKGAGKEVPESIMGQLRSENLMKDAKTDQDFDRLIRNLKDLKIEDGKLIIVPAAPADRPKLNP